MFIGMNNEAIPYSRGVGTSLPSLWGPTMEHVPDCVYVFWTKRLISRQGSWTATLTLLCSSPSHYYCQTNSTRSLPPHCHFHLHLSLLGNLPPTPAPSTNYRLAMCVAVWSNLPDKASTSANSKGSKIETFLITQGHPDKCQRRSIIWHLIDL